MALPDFDALWSTGDPAATEAKLRAILPDARASGDAAGTAILLTQIARAQGLQGRSEDAHRTLDEAKLLIRDDMTVPRVRYLLERGRATNGIPGATDPGAAERKGRRGSSVARPPRSAAGGHASFGLKIETFTTAFQPANDSLARVGASLIESSLILSPGQFAWMLKR